MSYSNTFILGFNWWSEWQGVCQKMTKVRPTEQFNNKKWWQNRASTHVLLGKTVFQIVLINIRSLLFLRNIIVASSHFYITSSYKHHCSIIPFEWSCFSNFVSGAMIWAQWRSLINNHKISFRTFIKHLNANMIYNLSKLKNSWDEFIWKS